MENLEKNKIKFYHIFYAIFIIPICTLVSLYYYWISYSILTKRSGAFGSLYERYNVTAEFFSIYHLLISLICFLLLCLIIKYFYKRNGDKLMNVYWLFLIFVLIITYCEYLLELRYISKG